MTVISFEDTLRSLLKRKPFEPFEAELTRGDRFTVDQAESLALNGRSAGYFADDGKIYFFTNETTERITVGVSGNST